VEAVAEWLRECILTGEIDLGERLIELKLAKTAGVGQPTVREALKELEHQGFVRRTPKHGTYVTRLTPDEFQKIHEVRMALEAVAIERAAVRIGDNEVNELRQYVRNMEMAAKRFDRIEFHHQDMAFHRRLWEVAENEFLAAALEQVVSGLFAFFLIQRKADDISGLVATARFHTPIIDGLRTGDPEIARTTFMDHTLAFWHKQSASLF
jgi:DNA-binding GntR family transcriptional regulator